MNTMHMLKAGAGWLYLNTLSHHPRPGNGVILMLHRVIADEREAALPHRNELCIGVHTFGQLLNRLRQHFDCVPLMELLEPHQPAGRRPRLALTFDDGWRDNATLAFPLLRRHRMPASIFLSTDHIGTNRAFWWESIGETLWGSHGAAAREHLRERLDEQGVAPPGALLEPIDDQSRSLALAHYLQELKAQSPDRLQALADDCPRGDEPQALDWQQVHQMETSGLVRFGPHGASHAILPRLDDIRLQQELRDSSAALHRYCRAALPVYCYPNGDHDARIRERLQHLHYRYALSTRPGQHTAQGDPLALPRIGVSHHTAQSPTLLAWRMLRGAR